MLLAELPSKVFFVISWVNSDPSLVVWRQVDINEEQGFFIDNEDLAVLLLILTLQRVDKRLHDYSPVNSARLSSNISIANVDVDGS